MQPYFRNYGSRPGLRKLFDLVYKLKKSGNVKAVVMYTNAEDIPKGYVNCLRKPKI